MIWDPLASRWGRLTAFFLLYMTEGIPLGFTATTVTTQMRRQGVSAGDVATFVAVLYLPWSWKWVMGPIVDCVYSRRLGRRRAWIVAAQSLMALTLCSGIGVDPVERFYVFMGLIAVVNVFGALQDVAIDALACKVLPRDERGLANGLMFAGAYSGQAVGGSLMLFLMAAGLPFGMTFLLVPALILLVTIFVGLPLREREDDGESPAASPALSPVSWSSQVWTEIRGYPIGVWRAFTGSRPARLALLFAALPSGGYALSLALQTNLSVEFGMTEAAIATLALVTTLVSGTFCAIGGKCSDLWGRRRVLGISIALLAAPGVVLAFAMLSENWVMPVDMDLPDRPTASTWLLAIFWSMTICYAVVHGFMYGIRTALFMDVVTPAVAATQFTAYMAVLNLVIAYTSFWHGRMIEALGYPMTLFCDAGAGLLCLVPLAMMNRSVARS